MAPNVFMYVLQRFPASGTKANLCSLGATGYIGGDALVQLVETHPEYNVTCLVRNSEKGAQVASQFARGRSLRAPDYHLHVFFGDPKHVLRVEIRRNFLMPQSVSNIREADFRSLP